MASTRTKVRLLALVDFAILLAVVLPGLLNHPYPRPYGPYIQYAGIVLYLVVGFYQVSLFMPPEPKGRVNHPSQNQ